MEVEKRAIDLRLELVQGWLEIEGLERSSKSLALIFCLFFHPLPTASEIRVRVSSHVSYVHILPRRFWLMRFRDQGWQNIL